MSTNFLSRVVKISLAACVALGLAVGFADASHHGNYGRGGSHHFQPSRYGYGDRAYHPSHHDGYRHQQPYFRPQPSCRPSYQPQPYFGPQGGYGRFR